MRNGLARRRLLGAAASLPLVSIGGARAATRSIQVGIYTAQQGEYVRKQIIPKFEADYDCKVFTTEGVTLMQIAALRATRENPKYSVMFMDDIGIELSKREGLIDKLPADKIPNLAGLLPRFLFYDGYGAAFAISTGGMVINPQVTKPLTSYADLWEPRFKQRFLMMTPKATQSLYLLIATASFMTGKPLQEAQYEIDTVWPKMAELKANVLSTYENPSQIMMVAQGQVDVAGIEYSKNIYPYTIQGAPMDMCFPKEGTFAGINCLSFVKGGPEPELAASFINRMLDPAVQQGLAAATLTSPSVKGATFAPEIGKYIAYPEAKMNAMGLFAADWTFINPRRPGWLEKYNQVFGS
ncbi:MAG: extracellular solute-binding protein [Acetobacteraceae bacterium]|jgi:putative spermidine/putrescine transport system substrate-binding protein